MSTRATLAILFQLWCSASFPIAQANDEWGEWNAAHQAQSEGRAAEAETALRAAPKDSAYFHYNLGTLAAQQGHWGRAVAHLEKANHLRPHHSSIQQNLRISRRSLARAGGPAETDLDRASSWLESIADHVPIEEVRAVLGMMGLLLVMLWVRQYRVTRDIKLALLQPAGLLAALAMLITAGLYAAERAAMSRPAAVLLESTLIRSGPGPQFTELSRIDAGSKVRVTSGDSGWAQVRYGPHEIGWITASSLLLL